MLGGLENVREIPVAIHATTRAVIRVLIRSIGGNVPGDNTLLALVGISVANAVATVQDVLVDEKLDNVILAVGVHRVPFFQSIILGFVLTLRFHRWCRLSGKSCQALSAGDSSTQPEP